VSLGSLEMVGAEEEAFVPMNGGIAHSGRLGEKVGRTQLYHFREKP
jgi:hypothetical protein